MVGQPGRRTTLRQVAERAGVSMGTASAVFSGRAAVSTASRHAVERAASALGYRPALRRTTVQPTDDTAVPGVRSIGLVIRLMEHSLRTNPFYSSVLEGAQGVCATLGLSLSYELVVGIDRHDPLPLSVQRREAHGLLLVGYLPDHTVDQITATGVPCVLVDNGVSLGSTHSLGGAHSPGGTHSLGGVRGARAATLDAVRNDDERGGYLAVRHLLDLGHTDPVPAMIAGPAEFPSISDRLRGYRRAIVDAGYTVDPELIRTTTLSPTGGRAQMAELLDLPTPPTAVFCCNDATALGALATLRERGISVPEDISVVGYDDIELAGQAAPPLTTVRVDKELMGAQSVWHLLQRIRRPAMSGRETLLEVSLVVRDSTAPPRHHSLNHPHHHTHPRPPDGRPEPPSREP
ncbi:LacI family DNA-binding transcriptional regulator [Actinopolymorpha sp. B11F2]|uniref:LacI family DNA-binding transcriptional regulator n=1 Tax=Actinopolymorpha sp. B11F2 TaxID=3160862 RepID=UPI0032E3B123